jgi:hypothetical protein
MLGTSAFSLDCRWDGLFSPGLIAARAYFGGEEFQNRT